MSIRYVQSTHLVLCYGAEYRPWSIMMSKWSWPFGYKATCHFTTTQFYTNGITQAALKLIYYFLKTNLSDCWISSLSIWNIWSSVSLLSVFYYQWWFVCILHCSQLRCSPWAGRDREPGHPPCREMARFVCLLTYIYFFFLQSYLASFCILFKKKVLYIYSHNHTAVF